MKFCVQTAFGLSLSILMLTPATGATLEQAIKDTLNSHPQIKASANSRFSADQDVVAAKGGYLPTLELSAGTGWERTDNASTRAAGDHYRDLQRSESGINLKQNLFNGFATTSEVARQKATVNSRAFAVSNTAEATALITVQSYLDVLMQEKMVKLAEENLKSHERIFDQIRLRTQRGVGREADYAQAEARLAQARNNLLTEQTNLADSRVNYASATGQEAIDLTMPQPAAIPPSLPEARKAMLINNPLLKQSDADIEATRQQYEAANSRFYPSVDVDVGRRMDNNLDGTRGHNQEWQTMLRMRYNLYNGGSDKAQLSSYAYKIQEAQDVKKNVLRQLNEELGLAWNALLNAKQQVPIAKEYADRSKVVRIAYQEQFTLGDRSLLDMLDSENEVFSAQRRYVQMQFLEMFTAYRINARTGELLKQLNIQAPSGSQSTDWVQTSETELPELK